MVALFLGSTPTKNNGVEVGESNGIPVIRTSGSPNGLLYARHLDTTNVLYGDGHVKAQSVQQLYANRQLIGGDVVLNDFTINED